MKTIIQFVLFLTLVFNNVAAISKSDSALINYLESRHDTLIPYAFIYFGFKDKYNNDFEMAAGYDPSKSERNIIRKEIIINGKTDTIFKFIDTIKNNKLLRNIQNISIEAPQFIQDTSNSNVAVDSCFGKGVLFYMTSYLNGISRAYQNCCSNCKNAFLERVESEHIFRYSRKELLKISEKYKK